MKGVKFFLFMLGVALLFSMSFLGCEELTPRTLHVSFSSYSIDGSYGHMEDQYFEHGATQSLKPNAFKCEGYKFKRWRADIDGETVYFDDEQSITYWDKLYLDDNPKSSEPKAGDFVCARSWITLRPEWTYVGMHHIIFHKNAEGVTGDMPPWEKVTRGEPYTLPSCWYLLDCYVFAGWALSPDGPVVYSDGETITTTGENEDFNLYAKWIPDPNKTYTVTFYSGNYAAIKGSMEPQTFIAGKSKALTECGFFGKNYTFKGWATYIGGEVVYTDKQAITVNSNMSLFAVFEYVTPTYTVTFNKNNSSATGSMNPQTFTSGKAQALTANGFTCTGYNFKGWSKTSGGSVVYSDKQSILVDSNMTLYAVWEAKKFTISFNRSTSEATGTMSPQTFTYGIKQNISSNGFTRTGYNFKGWAKSASGSVVYSDKQYIGIDSDMTLYAVWELVAVTSVSLNKTSLCLDSKTPETFQLTATVYPSNAFQSVTWKSSDPSIATVSSTGLVTAKGSGWKSATITCTSSYGGKTDTCKVEAYKSPTINGNEMSAGDYYSKGGIFKRTIERKFWLSTYETSKDEYEKYCCYLVDPFKENWGWKSTTPAFGMTWLDAIVYCNLKSKAEGLSLCYSLNGETDVTKWEGINSRGSGSSKRYCGASNYNYYPTWYAQIECDFSLNGYRLPTEAEWEAFARHGYDKNSDCYIGGFPLGYTNLGSCMNFNAGEREPGKYTLIKPRAMMPKRHAFYDLGGNVAEWCWDRWSDSYPTGPVENYTGATNGDGYRVVKGGDVQSGNNEILASARKEVSPILSFDEEGSCLYYVGIRLCRTVTN